MDNFKLNDVNGNKADPLKQPRSENGEQLFKAMSQLGSGFSYDDVVVASVNLVLNAIRQKCATSKEAEAAFDELAAKAKGVLLEQHYTMGGRRKGIFPYLQTITPGMFDTRPKNRK